MLRLALLLLAQDPAPGIIDPSSVALPPAQAAPRAGTPREALDAFLEAHALHKKGDLPAALVRYLEFQAIDGAARLPARYRAMAAERVGRLLQGIAKEYDDACALYRRDRARGVEALRAIAARDPALPHARAAAVVLETDALRQAIDDARQSKDAKALERAIRELPRGLYQYEAKALLVELGGPDLNPPKAEEGESSLETGGGG